MRITFALSIARTSLALKHCEMAEAALSRFRTQKVLSIQSHVVHGYAGNKCSVFPLQLHGFEVDFINSVQFSNHTAYEHLTGQRLTDVELESLYDGLKKNNINSYTHILTGYCGNVDFLRRIADIVGDLKKKDINTFFVCDPVMGDNGKYYTPQELLPVYRDVIIPLADVLTPNAFELGELTGTTIQTEEECLRGMDAMHERGVRVVVVTSGVEGAQTADKLVCFASTIDKNTGQKKRYKFSFPRVPGHFVGTGDVFASLLVVWLTELNGDVAAAVSRVLGSLQGLLRTTNEYAKENPSSKAPPELRLVQSRMVLLTPPETIAAELINENADDEPPPVSVRACPSMCNVEADGGTRTVNLRNPSNQRVVFKLKSTNNASYRFSPVTGFIEPRGSAEIVVQRKAGAPRDDLAVVQFAAAPTIEGSATVAFEKRTSEAKSVLIFLSAK